MSEDKHIPAIRFKGFTDPWEQRKLGELYARRSEKNDGNFGLDKVISVANMRFNPSAKASDDSYLRTYNMMRVGDIAFEGNRSKHFAHGRFVENDIGDGIVSHVFEVLKPIQEYDLLFWKQYIHDEHVMRKVLVRSTKATTMMHSVVINDFLEESIPVPPTLAEQRRIGLFFRQLDNLIVLHQGKYDELVSLKKSMLEKMFPKSGSRAPEIRFSGFTNPWEQRKVGDFLTLSRIPGHTGADAKKITVKLWGKGVVEKTDSYGGSVQTRYYVRHAGQFMYGKLDFLHAAFGIVPDELDGYESTLDSPAFDTHDIDGQFLINRVTQEDFFLKYGMIANGSRKAKRVHENVFLEMPIQIPIMFEQKKIGQLFQHLDNLITLHHRKLDLLKNVKKSLLEKMFV